MTTFRHTVTPWVLGTIAGGFTVAGIGWLYLRALAELDDALTLGGESGC